MFRAGVSRYCAPSHEKTQEFLRRVLSVKSDQEARDMIAAACRLGTLKSKHLSALMVKAHGSGALWQRCMSVVDVALTHSDELRERHSGEVADSLLGYSLSCKNTALAWSICAYMELHRLAPSEQHVNVLLSHAAPGSERHDFLLRHRRGGGPGEVPATAVPLPDT